MIKHSFLPALFLVVCTSLHADVTMRMAFDFKINMAVPGGAPSLPFNEMVTRIKGDRGYASMGPIVALTNLATGQMTLLDPKGQRFATMAMADYLSKIGGAQGQATANIPEQAKQILAMIKFDTQSHDTGRTDKIQGIDAYEREVVVDMSIPVPLPGQEKGLHLIMKFQLWKPQPGEFERVPALRELAAYNERNKGLSDPATILRQMFSSLPGMGDNASKMVGELTKGGNVMLAMHMGVAVPGLAKMMEQMQPNSTASLGLPEGDKPLLEVNVDLKDLNNDKVPEETFAAPTGYKEAPMEDLVKGLTAAFTGGK
jgi:hypothetical protein